MPAPAANGEPSLGPLLSYVSHAKGGFPMIATLALALYWVLEGELDHAPRLFFVAAERREGPRGTVGRDGGQDRRVLPRPAHPHGHRAVPSAAGYLVIGLPYALGLALIAASVRRSP